MGLAFSLLHVPRDAPVPGTPPDRANGTNPSSPLRVNRARRIRFPLRSFHAWVCDAGSAALVDVPRGEDGWATSGRLTRATRWRGLQLGSRPFDMRGRIRVICYALEVSSTLCHHHSGLHLRPSVPPRPIDVGRTLRDRQEQCRCPFRSGQSGSASCLRGWQYSSAPGQSLPRR